MSPQITDPDVRLLATMASSLEPDYVDEKDSQWARSPFAWIKTRPSRQRGKIGEQLVAGFCAAKGLDVVASGDTEADRIIAGYRVEIKFSTVWKSGRYTFQQIRDQDYAYLICLGLAPFDAKCWVASKAELYKHVIGHTPQHAGRAGSDTFWLHFPAGQPPEWLRPRGGRLRDAVSILQGLQRD